MNYEQMKNNTKELSNNKLLNINGGKYIMPISPAGFNLTWQTVHRYFK
ncbi:hypothetical protein [Fructilactobacillus frigidiflavus]